MKTFVIIVLSTVVVCFAVLMVIDHKALADANAKFGQQQAATVVFAANTNSKKVEKAAFVAGIKWTLEDDRYKFADAASKTEDAALRDLLGEWAVEWHYTRAEINQMWHEFTHPAKSY